ncbi:MAG: D-Ala-D-Ala carboxypeptidase family metallohydrolase [Candidatus Faecousia sp.]|nr:D-Ala-D-Ala carboxypeptidase family metallohydrolase [Candidatus Faecousia sp.]
MTIRQVQLLLSFLGYDPGAPDGIDGEKTQSAVRLFQAREGLREDGIAGSKTQERLLDAVAQGRMYTRTEPKAENGTGDFWKDIRYFSRNEPYIACSCGSCGGFPVEPDEKLMRLADRVRQQAGAAMIPSSTVRCRAHNAEVGGVANSRHLAGKAMDFSVRGWTAERTLALVRQQKEVRYAYAIDGTHVHMDIE